MNGRQSANERPTILPQSSRKEMGPVPSEVRQGISRIDHIPTGSFSYFPAPLDPTPIIAPAPAEIRSSSHDVRATLPPSPLAGARAEPVVNVTAFILLIKFARALLKL